jgi:putative ABC transport system permease protein
MKAADLFRLSTRMFRTRPMRTWLTILGISVGTGAVLFLVALGFGLQNIILQKIVFNKALLSLSVTSNNENIVMTPAVLGKFRLAPSVTDVAPLARYNGQMWTGELSGNASFFAVPASYFDYAGIAPLDGRLYKENATGEVVISSAVLQLFGLSDDGSALGKTVKIQIYDTKDTAGGTEVKVIDLPQEYKIIGVVEGAQDSFVYLPLYDVESVVPVSTYEQAQVAVSSSEALEPVKEEFLNMGFQVSSLSETVDQANKIFNVIQIVLGVFGAFALMVSSIGMFNTMTVTLLERTNEIGVMRALGASREAIMLMFLTESFVIGLLGGLVGVGIGFFGGIIFNFGINVLAARFGGAAINLFSFPLNLTLAIIGISTIIGFLSGVFPSRRAAKLDPLEALRYK